MTHETFLNDKARILNEILESARSLNNNGFLNAENHLREALGLMKKLSEDIEKEWWGD